MKLYTEEQVKDILIDFTTPIGVEYYLSKLTPIELPSDEEIRKMSLPTNVGDSYHSEYIKGFNYGAKWVIEQIKEQDNGGSRD